MVTQKYDVIPVSAALRAIIQMPTDEQNMLIDCLLQELDNPPANASLRFRHEGKQYTAKVLSCGTTCIMRPAARRELERAARSEARQALARGYIIFDLLAPGAAFNRLRPFGG